MMRVASLAALTVFLALAGCAEDAVTPPMASVAPAPAVSQQPPVMPTRRPEPKPVTLAPAPDAAASVPPPAPLVSPAPVVEDRVASAVPPVAAAPVRPSRVRQTAPPGVSLALRTPSLLPKVPGTVTLAVEAKLSNDGTLDALLSVPTACDVAQWEITDRAGEVVLAKEPAICAQAIAESTLRAGEILVARDRIEVPGESLKAGGRYRLRYAFWGAVAEAEIAVQ